MCASRSCRLGDNDKPKGCVVAIGLQVVAAQLPAYHRHCKQLIEAARSLHQC